MTNIERLFEGSLDVPRRCGTGAELREVEGHMERHRSALEGTLTGNEKEIFSRHCACVEEALFLYGRECFVQGFSLGSGLTAEGLLEAAHK